MNLYNTVVIVIKIYLPLINLSFTAVLGSIRTSGSSESSSSVSEPATNPIPSSSSNCFHVFARLGTSVSKHNNIQYISYVQYILYLYSVGKILSHCLPKLHCISVKSTMCTYCQKGVFIGTQTIKHSPHCSFLGC